MIRYADLAAGVWQGPVVDHCISLRVLSVRVLRSQANRSSMPPILLMYAARGTATVLGNHENPTVAWARHLGYDLSLLPPLGRPVMSQCNACRSTMSIAENAWAQQKQTVKSIGPGESA